MDEQAAVDVAVGDKRPANDDEQITTSEAKRQVQDQVVEEAEAPQTSAQDASSSAQMIAIKIAFGKAQVVVHRSVLSKVSELKQDIEKETGVPCANQKLLFKGQLKDEQTLQETGLKDGSKLMVIGTKPEDTKVAQKPSSVKSTPSDWDATAKKQPWSSQPNHKKVVDKGKPDDTWPGIAGRQVPLNESQNYIPGLLNSHGTKVRLTFRPEIEQVWIGSSTYTQKVPYSSIHKIEAQPIEEHPEYSILRLQLGSSSSSNYWLYWVPSQSVSGIKLRILGLASLLE